MWRGASRTDVSTIVAVSGVGERLLLESLEHRSRLIAILVVRMAVVGRDPAVHVVDRSRHAVDGRDRDPGLLKSEDGLALGHMEGLLQCVTHGHPDTSISRLERRAYLPLLRARSILPVTSP